LGKSLVFRSVHKSVECHTQKVGAVEKVLKQPDSYKRENIFVSGYIGRQPFSWPQFGQPQHQNPPVSCSSLDFAKSQQHRRSTEWTPIGSAGVGMYRPVTATVHGYHSPVIYHTSTGVLPTYQGHVPGHLFRWVAHVFPFVNFSYYIQINMFVCVCVSFQLWPDLWNEQS
jgi:hypothetical protein